MPRNYHEGKQGRPSVAEGYFDNIHQYYGYRNNKFAASDDGKPTDRTITNGIYMRIGLDTIRPAAAEYPVLTVLFPPEAKIGKVEYEKKPRSGILEQLGRMKQQNGWDDAKVIDAAVAAAISKQEGIASKTIEKELRRLRITGELNGEKW